MIGKKRVLYKEKYYQETRPAASMTEVSRFIYLDILLELHAEAISDL